MMRRALVVALVALAAGVGAQPSARAIQAARIQRGSGAGQSADRGGRGQSVNRAGRAQSADRAGRGQSADRAGLEMQLRQRLARRARIELGLSPDQMMKLADVNRRFAPQQRALDQRENQTRKALRQALIDPPSAEQEGRVGEMHNQILQFQQQRLDLMEAEQKELGGFMTNVQRVRFQGLQENFRRQMQDALAAQNGAPPSAQPGRPPV